MKNTALITFLIISLFLTTGCMSALLQDKAEIKIQVKNNDQSLKEVVSGLNDIYGKPTVEISAFRLESGEFVVLKKLYYRIDGKIFVIVSIVNDQVLFIDTVHAPERTEKRKR